MRSKGSLTKQKDRFKIPYKTERRLLFGAIVAFVGAVGAVASAGVFAPTDPASAVTEEITANLQQSNYFVRLLSEPSLSITMDTVAGSRVKAVPAGLKAQTNSPKGYAVYMSVDGSNTGLCRADDTSYTQCINSIESEGNLTDNTWGFHTALTDPAKPEETTTGWQGVQLKANASRVAVRDHASDDFESDIAGDGGEHIDLWFGVKATSGLSSGAYTNTVLYTVVSEAADMEGILLSSDSTNNFAGGDTLTITTPLMTSIDLTQPGWKPTVTIGSGPTTAACEITKIGPNKDTGLIEIDCTTPAMSAGTYDVTVSFPKFGDIYNDLTAQFTYGATGETTIASVSPDTVANRLTGGINATNAVPLTINTNVDYSSAITDLNNGVNVKAGDVNCPVTAFNDNGGKAQIVCNAPVQTTAGAKDISVTIPGYGIDTVLSGSKTLTYSVGGAETIASLSATEVDGEKTINSFKINTNLDYAGAPGTITVTTTPTGGPTCNSWTGSNVNNKLVLTCTTLTANKVTADTDYTFSVKAANYGTYGDAITSMTVKLKVKNAIPIMQNFTSSMCSTLPQDTWTEVIDSRDNTHYHIARMKDNKCWMVENLSITGTIKAADSDMTGATSDFTIEIRDKSYFSSSHYEDSAAYEPTGDDLSDSSHPDRDKYGVYYNWYTATAGTGRRYAVDTASGTVTIASSGTDNSQDGKDAKWSICPKGWRLPKAGTTPGTEGAGGSNSEFFALFNAYASDFGLSNSIWKVDSNNNGYWSNSGYGFAQKLEDSALFKLYRTGHYNSSGYNNEGGNSYLWSSTVRTAGSARRYSAAANYLYARSSSNKYDGYSVRCVFGS